MNNPQYVWIGTVLYTGSEGFPYISHFFFREEPEEIDVLVKWVEWADLADVHADEFDIDQIDEVQDTSVSIDGYNKELVLCQE